ncbi:hypothetical protein AVEN_248195-1 [Araneus ventricosus]|uniref:Uncharacterized protein n=1 Tax=Araneus ventricosus TaxID=182803 RepID=A0A4Y2XA34_ARAVE|nr:hypothetical protein AVEN_248195-1 [Araneus ventricosus]
MTRMTPEPVLPSSSFPTTPAGGGLAVTDLTSTRPAYTAVIRWNQVSSQEPFGFDVETLPPGHRGPPMHISARKSSIVHQYQTCCDSTVNGLIPHRFQVGVDSWSKLQTICVSNKQ